MRVQRTLKSWRRVLWGAVASAGAIVMLYLPGQAARPTQPPTRHECRWASGPIQIDGRLDEAAWKGAEVIERFSAHWQGKAARFPTKARLLWDDEYLYFAAEMADADLYADVTEHDDMTWLNDVFELFFKPADDKPAYYELQVNAANTKMDMLLPSRGSGGYRRWARAHPFHMESAVVLDGTLNQVEDQDRGWSVEGRLPWKDFAPTGGKPRAGQPWRFALCRYDYSVAHEREETTSCAPLTEENFHRYEDYAVLDFKGSAGK